MTLFVASKGNNPSYSNNNSTLFIPTLQKVSYPNFSE